MEGLVHGCFSDLSGLSLEDSLQDHPDNAYLFGLGVTAQSVQGLLQAVLRGVRGLHRAGDTFWQRLKAVQPQGCMQRWPQGSESVSPGSETCLAQAGPGWNFLGLCPPCTSQSAPSHRSVNHTQICLTGTLAWDLSLPAKSPGAELLLLSGQSSSGGGQWARPLLWGARGCTLKVLWQQAGC